MMMRKKYRPSRPSDLCVKLIRSRADVMTYYDPENCWFDLFISSAIIITKPNVIRFQVFVNTLLQCVAQYYDSPRSWTALSQSSLLFPQYPGVILQRPLRLSDSASPMVRAHPNEAFEWRITTLYLIE